MERNKKILIGAVAAALALILAVGFVLAYAGRDKTQIKDRTLHLSVNGCEMEVPLKKDGMTVDVPCLMTGSDNAFKLLGYINGRITVDGKALKVGKSVKIAVTALTPEKKLKVVVANDKDTRTVYLRTYSSQLPSLRITGTSAADGEYLITEKDKPVIYALNTDGDLIWYQALDADKTKVRFTDFRRHTAADGEIYYSYHRTNPDADDGGIADYQPGTRIVMDDDFNVITEDVGLGYYHPEKTVKKKEAGRSVDGHGFELLDKDDTLTLSYQTERVSNIPASLNPSKNATVVAAVLQEVHGSKVVWEWRSTNVDKLYALSRRGNAYGSENPQDYLHVNAMLLDPADNNLILSLQNADAIIKIDRETGKILWILGGKADAFGLKARQQFANVTDIALAADRTLVVTQSDKVTTFKLSETGKKVTYLAGYSTADAVSAAKLGQKQNSLMIAGNGTDKIVETFYDSRSNGLIIRMSGRQTLSRVRYYASDKADED
jgi:arylsulfate sulfotransferase